MRRFLREPLVHFLVAGGLLFVLYQWLAPGPQADPATIVVDETALVPFIQNRQPRLSSDAARSWLANLPASDRRALTADFVREEVLVREARALGLGETDFAARRRLVSQLEFVNEGFLRENLTFSDAELMAFYEDHAGLFQQPARITFTHVFFNAGQRSMEENLALAREKLGELQRDDVPFHRSLQHGDRFYYQPNYANRTRDEIGSHFGEDFADEIFGLEAAGTWQGPIRSDHGRHLVLVTAKQSPSLPPLDEVRARVADRLLSRRLVEARDAFYEAARENYSVIVELPARGESE